MDHHCPVTGKCIGRGNIVCFFLMIIWSYAAIIFCMWVVYSSMNDENETRYKHSYIMNVTKAANNMENNNLMFLF